VDEWLAGMPKRKDHFWVKQRVAFNAEHGTAAPLVEDLMTSVRNHPEDTDRALALLDTLRETRRSSSSPHDLSWMADTLRPEGTTASFAVAERLRRLGMCSTALSFYEQALKTPLTRDELRSMARCRQTMTSDEMLRAGHGIQIRERMAACLLELGRAEEAQELMVSAADMRKRHNLSGNMMLAGQVQRQSSQRVIQERVLEEESTSKDNPEYWQARARYYRGRGETDEERAALDRGLRLTDPAHNSEATQQDVSRWRTGLLAAYVHFLERRGQKALAVHALHEEVRRFPPDARSTIAAVSMLTMEFPDGVTGDDEVLWNWLEARPQWEYTEERLLWAMLERPGSEDVDALLRKAEHLCRQAHPSRGLAVGWVKNRLGVGAQAVPLVREALARAEERQIKDNLAVVLFKSYLDAGDWRNAEELFPEASKRLTAGEMCSWYARIAAAAAQAGARQDALRLWRGVMNANPGRHGKADVLVRAGMREDICALYRDLAARLPSASAVEKGMEGLPCARDVQPASPSD
jgi:tetratricopeptide (TPR) repeat protein